MGDQRSMGDIGFLCTSSRVLQLCVLYLTYVVGERHVVDAIVVVVGSINMCHMVEGDWRRNRLGGNATMRGGYI